MKVNGLRAVIRATPADQSDLLAAHVASAIAEQAQARLAWDVLMLSGRAVPGRAARPASLSG